METQQRPGAWLRKMRLKLGMTQRALGDSLGRSGQWVSNVETGRAKLPVADRLAVMAMTLGPDEFAAEALRLAGMKRNGNG